MPLFTPARRWQPAYYSFKREKPSRRALAALERAIKGPLFGCRMCGNCLLQETAFICSMECPKGARNGPCGGSTPERCYVDPTRPCVWYKIYERAEKMGRQEKLLEVLPPLDWDRVGTETWADVWNQITKVGVRHFFGGLLSRDPRHRAEVWDSVFEPVRQPEWWQGDAQYHAPAYDEPMSELERRLKAGQFVVTAEVAPPLTIATRKLCSNVNLIKPYVAAINFTDSPSATPRMSSWACSVLARQTGAEPRADTEHRRGPARVTGQPGRERVELGIEPAGDEVVGELVLRRQAREHVAAGVHVDVDAGRGVEAVEARDQAIDLGARVVRRAEAEARLGHAAAGGGAHRQRNPEVGHHRPAVVEQDVFRLDVAVDDALVVGGGEGLGQGGPDRQQPLDRHPSVGDELVEGLTFDELHGQEVDAGAFFNRVDGDDAGVVEGGERLRFARRRHAQMRLQSTAQRPSSEQRAQLIVSELGGRQPP